MSSFESARIKDAAEYVYTCGQQYGISALHQLSGLIMEYGVLHGKAQEADPLFGGGPLPAKDYNIKYIAEKFRNVFGETLQDPELRKIFLKEMGWIDGKE